MTIRTLYVYWTHSENILLAMLASKEADIRAKTFAIQDAKKVSGDIEKQGKVRKSRIFQLSMFIMFNTKAWIRK